MAKSMFKRNYDNGEVTLPDGRIISVLTLPADSINYFAVYGFIRACQDPTGGEKVESVKQKAQMEIAESLIAGTHEKKKRSYGSGLEDKLDEKNAQLVTYDAASDDDKRMLAKMGINRTAILADIKAIEKKIEKRDAPIA